MPEFSHFILDLNAKCLVHFFQNCINQFIATAQSDRCSFIGNVDIGKDVKIAEMLQAYDAVVMVS